MSNQTSITTERVAVDGVVQKLPYAIITNFRLVRPFSLSIVGADPVSGATIVRKLPTLTRASKSTEFYYPIYVGDVITLQLKAAANSTNAAVFDIFSVNQTTGTAADQASIVFTAAWQTKVVVSVTAIATPSGAVTYATALS